MTDIYNSQLRHRVVYENICTHDYLNYCTLEIYMRAVSFASKI